MGWACEVGRTATCEKGVQGCGSSVFIRDDETPCGEHRPSHVRNVP